MSAALQKVVCIDASATAGRLQRLSIYEITSDDGHFISLAGVTGTYWRCRFRPIVERKTDISIFTRMLLPQGVDA